MMDKNLSPPQELNHGPLEPKTSALPISYADPFLFIKNHITVAFLIGDFKISRLSLVILIR